MFFKQFQKQFVPPCCIKILLTIQRLETMLVKISNRALADPKIMFLFCLIGKILRQHLFRRFRLLMRGYSPFTESQSDQPTNFKLAGWMEWSSCQVVLGRNARCQTSAGNALPLGLLLGSWKLAAIPALWHGHSQHGSTSGEREKKKEDIQTKEGEIVVINRILWPELKIS